MESGRTPPKYKLSPKMQAFPSDASVSPHSPTYDCIRDEDGNIISPLTNLPVKKERLVVLKVGDKNQCFDIDDLYRYWFDSNLEVPLNPFTRSKLPDEIINRIYDYEDSVKCLVTVKYFKGPIERMFEFYMSYHQHIGALISRVLSSVPDISLSAAINLDVICVNDSGNDVSLYFMDLESDTIGLPINLKLRPFQSEQSKLDSLQKLYDYTFDKQYEPGTNNEAVNHYAEAVIRSTRTRMALYSPIRSPTRLPFRPTLQNLQRVTRSLRFDDDNI
jgi:hypothetical protein